MTLKSTRIYRIMGTNFSGKMAHPSQEISLDTPPPQEDQHLKDKFAINMLAANDVNLRILTYLIRSRK